MIRLGLILFFFGAIAKAGDLKWEQTTVALKAEAADKRVEADFVFSNTSNSPVTIRNVSTSCGCTAARLEKKVYQPEESGELKVVFTLGGRKGLQEKTVIVSSGKTSQDILMLRVDIPDSVVMNKEMLSWNVGDPLEAQSFEATVQNPETTKVRGVKALGSKFEAELQELEEGRKYLVKVKPTTTDSPQRGTVRLEIADPGRRSIYLRVAVNP